ncbi:MAG: hypothetical protein KIT33_15205 [Candidatus Kapabacteria bacterium]|nr:hypothetical protein [Ignavibacteriota bacterium]MCW5886317.1 hypothetical protein [Candidatus Kapabacteria bacterium]
MKFRTKQPIVNGGKIYKKDSIIDLTPKQARYLSDYIVAIPENVKVTITGEKEETRRGSNSKTNKGDGK